MWRKPYRVLDMHAKWTLIHLRGIAYFWLFSNHVFNWSLILFWFLVQSVIQSNTFKSPRFILHAYPTRDKVSCTYFTGPKLIPTGKVFFIVVEKNISITKPAKFSTEKIHIHIFVEAIIYMSTSLVSTWASCLTSYFVFCRFKSPTKNIPYSATFRNYFH